MVIIFNSKQIMDDQYRICRLLTLLSLMSNGGEYSIEYLARVTGTSTRTIYRFIESARSVGFVINRLRSGIFQIVNMNQKSPELTNLVSFTPAEASLLDKLLNRLDATNAFKCTLKRKLSAVCSAAVQTDYYENKFLEIHIDQLSEAIRGRRCVTLHQYESSQSRTRDRFVEPFTFSKNGIDVWAYEHESGKCKMFKISRIGAITITDEEWSNEVRHKVVDTDVFRMSGDDSIHIQLVMGNRAKNLLLEEYPKAVDCVYMRKDGKWMLDTVVYDIAGAGRFVMGLAKDIEVVDSPELVDYIRQYYSEWTSRL